MYTSVTRKILSLAFLFIILILPLTGCNSSGDGFLEPGMIGPDAGAESGPISTNVRPVANAGADQTVKRGVTVTLDGSQSSDTEGAVLRYSWRFDTKPPGSNASIMDTSLVNPTFTPDLAGSYRIKLIVSDESLESNPDSVDITAFANTPPVAKAGPDQNANVGVLVTLDGSGSSDLNGDSLIYSWTMSKPTSSSAALSSTTAANPTFTPDVPGTYSFYLSVFDGMEYSNLWDRVDITVSFTAIADAGPDQYLTTGSSTVVTLDGSGSYDSAGRSMTYAWSFTRKPAGSTAMLSDPSAVQPTLTADLEGKYELSLNIYYNGYVNSLTDKVLVIVISNKTITELTFRVIDAEYSKQLERIIMVSGTPSNQLHIYDPVTGVDETIDLPALPMCVSVSPNGQYAAIGHSTVISYIDLVLKAVVKTLQVTGDIVDIVLAGNGYVYPFPYTGLFYGVNISTGVTTTGAGIFPWPGRSAKLHPSGGVLYVGAGSYTIQKYDISSGDPVYLYDSSYPGRQYGARGDLWMIEDGAGFITKGASIFPASAGSTRDLLPKASLSDLIFIGLQHAADSSSAVQIAVVPATQAFTSTTIDDTEVWTYDDQSFTLENTIALPHYLLGDSNYAGHGKFIFYNSTGTNIFVILQADATAGLTNDFGIVKY